MGRTKEEEQVFRDRVWRFRLLDDKYMRVFFDGRPQETALVLRIILSRPDIESLQRKTYQT